MKKYEMISGNLLMFNGCLEGSLVAFRIGKTTRYCNDVNDALVFQQNYGHFIKEIAIRREIKEPKFPYGSPFEAMYNELSEEIHRDLHIKINAALDKLREQSSK